MERPQSLAPTPTTSQKGPPEESRACKECQRRRVKCDGSLPECTVCQRYRRHCLYDKHSRTRLTRKQLTLLETRLERAQQLLRSQYSQQQIADLLDGKTSQPVLDPNTTPLRKDVVAETRPSDLPTPYPKVESTSVTHPTFDATQQGPSDSQTAAAVSLHSPDNSFDLDPVTADNFEWNEQDSSWSMAHGSGSNFPQTITDGMASLAIGERRGYLGAVSGAALLRQVLSSDRDGQGAHTGSPWQQYDSLFQQRLDQSQWFQTKSMLTRVAVENLFDAYFEFYHPTFPIIHEPTFRAQYANVVPRHDNLKWIMLANIVAALGSFAGSLSADATDLSIFQEAQKSLFADNLEAGTLTLVQAFALSATYLQKRNKPNTGYNYSGIALRLAIGLGLHKDYQEGHISALQVEIRRRVWWTLCILDVGAVVSYGRPQNWPRAGVDAALPRNVHEEDIVSDSATSAPEIEGLTIYTYLRVQSSYHLRTMSVYSRLISRPFPAAAELVALDDENIGAWLAQIPTYYSVFPPGTSKYALGLGITKWRYRNLRIVMYRPFLIRWALGSPSFEGRDNSSTEALAVFRCLDAAKETILSIEEYWTTRSHSRLGAWYVLYFLFHATLIPLHCLRQNPQHSLAPDWRAQIRFSVAIMDAMSDLCPNSSNCRDITVKLSWPHLEQDAPSLNSNEQAQAQASFEAASKINDYNAWCEHTQTTDGEVPMYQWPDIDENGLNFFYGAGFGRGF